ncbi:hypothetical protein LJC63_12945, partial [Ruminococcaceae bacterium OttesenSCG-928-L11]|nr:hypothetical protein [Ruminococcaceae bacterium OttesenSCG-928-L11]
VAQLDGRYAVWYCQYDGMGAEDVTYIGVETSPEPIDEYSSGINLLSAAAATSAFIFAEGYEQVTPEEFIEIPDAYWQTVVYAMTMHKENTEGDFDPYSGELMRVPAWLTDACRLAFFPGTEAQPLYTQGGGVYMESGDYLMYPCSYGDEIFWEYISSESSAGGKTGSVVIAVYWPELSPDPFIYRVEWAANDAVDPYSPFPYHMTGISRVNAS